MLAAQVAITVQNAMLFEKLELTNRELAIAYDATIEGWSQARGATSTEEAAVSTQWPPTARRCLSGEDCMGAGFPLTSKIARVTFLMLSSRSCYRLISVVGLPRGHPESCLQDAFVYSLSPSRLLNIPDRHHEKWDSTGYPRRLKGEEIPLEARIFAVVDVWDALTSDRPYRSAWSRKKTLEYIASQAGTQFDPQVVVKFMNMV